jgi:integrase/recombinase XerD
MGIWADYIENFSFYLKIERNAPSNTVEAYVSDAAKLEAYVEAAGAEGPENVTSEKIRNFLAWMAELGIEARSQSRILSGIKAFYEHLQLENLCSSDPTQSIDMPRIGRHLPSVLAVEEIDAMIAAIDLSTNEGQRNCAIVETLYSCGLRVSELCNMLISDMRMNEGFIKIKGKGSKERLVPISGKAVREISLYMSEYRRHWNIAPDCGDILFLNRYGRQLTRVMVFTIIKKLAQAAGIEKKVSPHTLRHSFATHMVDAGADLRAVQEMLGHESILTTEIYTHLDRHHLRQSMEMHHPRSRKRQQ